MIAVVDYGMANLRSVEKALAFVGGDPIITSDPEVIKRADKVVLPGVGAFCACMNNLNSAGLQHSIRDFISSGKPFLGICVGLQMLFDESSEMGDSPGLGLFAGKIVKFFENGRPDGAEDLNVPQIGWNELNPSPDSKLMRGIETGSRVYFVHSFYPVPLNPEIVAATSDYGGEFCCAIEHENVAATQFHPEKSGRIGLQILRNFIEW